MPKRKNGKKAKRDLQPVRQNSRTRQKRRMSERKSAPPHQEIKKELQAKDREPHDQFCNKQPSKEAIMGLASKKVGDQVLQIRRRAPCFGPRRMKHFFDIPCSQGAIFRIIRQAGLARPRGQKVRKRNDLRAIKAERHQAFEFLQMDIKYLTDIPIYAKQLKPLALPKFQYTVRDTRSGLLFLGYFDELSELNARTMVDYVIRHFQAAGVDAQNVTVQTDNGSEFSGMAKYENTATFVKHLEGILGANHRYIRPAKKDAQADVESSHWWIEYEFYDLTTHDSRADFLQNAQAYRIFFNLVRPNFARDAKTPWQMAQECLPNTDITSVLSLLPVIDLDQVAGPSLKRGQTIPELAGSKYFTFKIYLLEFNLFRSHPRNALVTIPKKVGYGYYCSF